ncbi:MAG: tRNA (cytidine(34)-2'-O)-methyltransferase [Verrucomicrobiota bacterium]
MFEVVLVEPEIPPNTGNVGRLCLATGSRLHLIEPLGFSIDDKSLRRAGLDYWKEVQVRVWPNLEACLAEASAESEPHYFTTKAAKSFWEGHFREGDYLVFGRETKGLPESLIESERERCFRIPMEGTRSLNLATSVGIVVYEGMRQLRG